MEKSLCKNFLVEFQNILTQRTDCVETETKQFIDGDEIKEFVENKVLEAAKKDEGSIRVKEHNYFKYLSVIEGKSHFTPFLEPAKISVAIANGDLPH